MTTSTNPLWYVLTWQAKLRAYLYAEGYGYGSREIIISHAERNGTAAGCEWVDAGDREKVEKIVKGGQR